MFVSFLFCYQYIVIIRLKYMNNGIDRNNLQIELISLNEYHFKY